MHGGKIGEEDLAKARVAGPILGAGKFPSVLFSLADQGGKADDLLAGRPFEDGRLSGRDMEGLHAAELEGEFPGCGVDDETVAAADAVGRGLDLEHAEASAFRHEGEEQVCAFGGSEAQGNLGFLRIAAPEVEEGVVAQGGLERAGDVGERDFKAVGVRALSRAEFRRLAIAGIKAGDAELDGGGFLLREREGCQEEEGKRGAKPPRSGGTPARRLARHSLGVGGSFSEVGRPPMRMGGRWNVLRAPHRLIIHMGERVSPLLVEEAHGTQESGGHGFMNDDC